jgi:1-acyl-sn-glycerol-3-phosphate acyltransferase
MINSAAWRSIRAASKQTVAKDLQITVHGVEHLPPDGPVLLVARHYHHLYDGCAVMATVPRQVRVLVGLDWIERPIALRGMQAACQAAGWPMVYRNTSETDRARWLPALREAMRQSIQILRDGKLLLVFPEGYPTIDPHPTPKTRDDEILPFQCGFVRIARDAHDADIPLCTIPLGFHYDQLDGRWRVTMRFGAPLELDFGEPALQIAERVRASVSQLSVA